MPLAETGTARGADLTKEFSAGQTVKVQVLETDRKTGRIRLSIKGAAAAEERAMYASYMGTESTGRGLGTLGDLFRDKFGK